MQSSLKFYRRLNLYKASNLVYNPVTKIALSYNWYQIYKVINGIRCLNTYNYSATTVKHISKMRRHFGYDPNIFEFEAPRGLQDLDRAIEYYRTLIKIKQAEINNPRSHKRLLSERVGKIVDYLNIISKIERLIDGSWSSPVYHDSPITNITINA